MKYILYFDTLDNDTYFYNSIDELLEFWHCKSLNEFTKCHSSTYFCIYKVEKIIKENKETKCIEM